MKIYMSVIQYSVNITYMAQKAVSTLTQFKYSDFLWAPLLTETAPAFKLICFANINLFAGLVHLSLGFSQNAIKTG